MGRTGAPPPELAVKSRMREFTYSIRQSHLVLPSQHLPVQNIRATHENCESSTEAVVLDQIINALLDSAAGKSPHLGYEGQGTACCSFGFSTYPLVVSFVLHSTVTTCVSICAPGMGQVVSPIIPSLNLARCLNFFSLQGSSAPT